MLRRNCVLIDSNEGEIKEVTIKRGIGYKQLLNDVCGKRGYLKIEVGSNKLQFG
jgi:hypothetical protein